MRRKFGVVHGVCECRDCGWTGETYKNAQALAARHARHYGHLVVGEVGCAYEYDGRGEKPPEVWTQEELDRAAKRAEKWKPLLSLPSSPPARGREKPPEEGAK